ncbi:FxLYD domain-containing protein [Chloroflexota bacterium]
MFISTDYWIAYEFTLPAKGDVLEGEVAVSPQSGDVVFYITDGWGNRLVDKGRTEASNSCYFRMKAPASGTIYRLWFAGEKDIKKHVTLSYNGTAEYREYKQTPEQTPMAAHLTEATLVIKHSLPETNPWYNLHKELTNVFIDSFGEIYCRVKVSDAPDDTQLKVRWLFVKDKDANLYNEQIYEESVIVGGTNYTDFALPPKSSEWLPGNYEVKLYLNGEEKATVPFDIVEEVKKLEIRWMRGLKDGVVEGSVKNVGNVPLDNVQIEASFYNEDGKLVRTASTAVELSTPIWGEFEGQMFPGGMGHCTVEMQAAIIEIPTGAVKLHSYEIRFFLPSGETVPHNDNWDFTSSGVHLLKD